PRNDGQLPAAEVAVRSAGRSGASVRAIRRAACGVCARIGDTTIVDSSITPTITVLQQPRIEWKREQILQPMTTLLASQVGENHFEIAADLPEDLAARAARRRRRVRIGDDGNPTELSMSFRERLEHRHTLGAYRQAIRRVLD